MNVIDHRILIPVAQDVVWRVLSDLTQNTHWQADCKAISILTTLRMGNGTRWRYTSQAGRDYVVEATAWYDRLGYEYRYVDGTNFRVNKGILRLQELPEGTVVQWTFSYELSGLFGGLQNALSAKRQIEGNIIDSLRMLYRYMTKTLEAQKHEAKSLMRDAPNVEARAQYKPRHPSVVEQRTGTGTGSGVGSDTSPVKPITGDSAANPITPVSLFAPPPPPAVKMPPSPGVSAISEPPVTQGDTKPNRAVIPPPPAAASSTPAGVSGVDIRSTGVHEPDFLASLKRTDAIDTVTAASGSAAPAPRDPEADARFRPPAEKSADPAPAALAAPPTPPSPAGSVSPSSIYELPRIEGDSSELDTSKVSVFEVFGLPKPSETQEMQAVNVGASSPMAMPPLPVVPPAPSIQPTPQERPTIEAPTPTGEFAAFDIYSQVTQSTTVVALGTDQKRVGLRIRQRRKWVKVRRPI